MSIGSYEEVRKYREQKIDKFVHDHFLLNQFHDEMMLQVAEIAIKEIEKTNGKIPAPFSFFVMGSAGRFEQGIWSDQDHGIIYEETNEDTQAYFLRLGKEISQGLYQAGYEYCDGNVMAGNPAWCKSRLGWQQHISSWVQNPNWESIRSLLILMDSRVLIGEKEYMLEIKNFALQSVHREKLLSNIFNNTNHHKKGIGILGQFLTETHGSYTGQLNLKETIIFPFVNAIRFLAISEKISDAPTLTRIDLLSEQLFSNEEKERCKRLFTNLLEYRLLYGNHSNYEAGHFLNVEQLSKSQKKEIKVMMKTALSLCHKLRRLIEKDGYYGDE